MVYRPPTGSLHQYINSLQTLINGLNLLKVDVTILGDYNINYNQRHSKGYRLLKTFERDSGLKQLVLTDTRISNMFLSRIDLILTNMKDVANVKVLSDMVSDHLPIMIVKKHKTASRIKKWVTGRQYRNYNRASFEKSLLSYEWSKFCISSDPNILWKEMQTVIENSLDSMCPIKTYQVEEQQSRWITTDIRKGIMEKRHLLKLARTTKNALDWSIFQEKRRYLSSLIRVTKSNMVKTKLSQNKQNPKKFWETINDTFRNLKAKSELEVTLIDCNNSDVPIKDSANFMNAHFCSLGSMKNHNAPPNTIIQSVVDTKSHTEFEFVTVTEKEVKPFVESIDVNKSSSIQHLNSRLLKDAFIILLTQLTHLFNCSLGTNIFPSVWKFGKVVPIPKTKDKQYVSNWRPISLLSLSGKLLDKIVHRQLLNFLTLNGMLSKMQHGFTSGKSTSTALQDFMLYVTNYINSGKICSCVFIDLSKAFDSLNHVVLLQKL